MQVLRIYCSDLHHAAFCAACHREVRGKDSYFQVVSTQHKLQDAWAVCEVSACFMELSEPLLHVLQSHIGLLQPDCSIAWSQSCLVWGVLP